MSGVSSLPFNPPGVRPTVYKEQCIWCFATPEFPGGLYVCLNTHLCFCRNHLYSFAANTGQKGFLMIERERKLVQSEPEVKPKVTKLAIGVQGGFLANEPKTEFEATYSVVELPNLDIQFPLESDVLGTELADACKKLKECEDATLMQNLAVDAGVWGGEEKVETNHRHLDQVPNPPKVDPFNVHCEACGMQENLWLNLTDGVVGCGRKVYLGPGNITGGNEHAKKHFQSTGHPLVVKLGTITSEGADIYSYDEDADVIDPNLRAHLKHFGIDMDHLEKTEKTTLELQVELNQKYEWSAIQEEGCQLQPVYGPGYTGIVNIGSSCYINSVVQLLCMLPPFVSSFGVASLNQLIDQFGAQNPTDDFKAQLTKLIAALESGDYSKPPKEGEKENHLNSSIRPIQFRKLVGRGHPEFSTPRQQDAEEYIRYLLDLIERNAGTGEMNVVDSVRLKIEERLCDLSSKMVAYSSNEEVLLSVPIAIDQILNVEEVAAFEQLKIQRQEQKLPIEPNEVVLPRVNLLDCLRAFAAEDTVEGFKSPVTGEVAGATKRHSLATFPDYMLIQTKRFTVAADWTPKKLEVELNVPEVIDLEFLRAKGIQEGEKELPKDAKIETDPQVLQLCDFGFTGHEAKYALNQCNNKVEEAVEWLLVNKDNVPQESSSQSSLVVDQAALTQLCAMGFSPHQAKCALLVNDDLQAAVEWIFANADKLPPEGVEEPMDVAPPPPQTEKVFTNGDAKYELIGFISHMGASTHCGHYVCHLKKDGRFVIFNDEKVALSEKPPKGHGYIYLFKRVK